MDKNKVEDLLASVQLSLRSKNQSIESLGFLLESAVKAFNDTLRVYEAKLADFGLPVGQLGFFQIDSRTSTIPAGYVTTR